VWVTHIAVTRLYGEGARELHPLSLHDALPIWASAPRWDREAGASCVGGHDGWSRRASAHVVDELYCSVLFRRGAPLTRASLRSRSEEHTSELQSRENLVCRLLLEKKKTLRSEFSNQLTGIIRNLLLGL